MRANFYGQTTAAFPIFARRFSASFFHPPPQMCFCIRRFRGIFVGSRVRVCPFTRAREREVNSRLKKHATYLLLPFYFSITDYIRDVRARPAEKGSVSSERQGWGGEKSNAQLYLRPFFALREVVFYFRAIFAPYTIFVINSYIPSRFF